MNYQVSSFNRSFRAEYQMGEGKQAFWVKGTPVYSRKLAEKEIRVWRDDYGFEFPMRIVQTVESVIEVPDQQAVFSPAVK